MAAYSRTLLVVVSLFLLVGCSKTVDFDKSVVRNGLLYEAEWRNGQPFEPNSNFGQITTIWGWKPFSGTVVRYYENGQMMWKKKYVKGRRYGSYRKWNTDKGGEGIWCTPTSSSYREDEDEDDWPEDNPYEDYYDTIYR